MPEPTSTRVNRPPLALCLLLALLASGACDRGPTPEAVLRQHGWEPLSAPQREYVTILDPSSLSGGALVWRQILEASQAVDMDFSASAGQNGEIRSYSIERGRAYVLLASDRVVGAWIAGLPNCIPGVFPISATREELQSCT
jgi:hypothetical protein